MPTSCFSTWLEWLESESGMLAKSANILYIVHQALLKTCVISGRVPLNLAQLSVCHIPKLSSLQAVPVLQLFSLCLCFKSFSLPL
jgi:hypothetical protein